MFNKLKNLTCSKPTFKVVEQDAKPVQSWQERHQNDYIVNLEQIS